MDSQQQQQQPDVFHSPIQHGASATSVSPLAHLHRGYAASPSFKSKSMQFATNGGGNNAGSSSSPGRGQVSSSTAAAAAANVDPDKQLRTAVEWVMDAFERKSQLAAQDVAHWKQVCASQRQQMLTLEGEVGTLGRKLNDYENVIAQFQDGIVDGFELVMAAGSAFMLRCRLNSPIFSEKKQLALAKAALKEKYDALRKNAVQLDQFRKQIISMVEFSPNAIAIPDAETSFMLDAATVQHQQQQQQQQQQSESAYHALMNYAGASNDDYLGPTKLQAGTRSPLSKLHARQSPRHNTSSMAAMQQQSAAAASADYNDSFVVSNSDADPSSRGGGGDHGGLIDLDSMVHAAADFEALNLGMAGTSYERDVSLPFEGDAGAGSMAAVSPARRRLHERQQKQKRSSVTQQQQQQQQMRSAPSSAQQQQRHIKSTSPSHQTSFAGDISVDAPSLYKQIREVLTPAEFDQFATHIANFNAGIQSAPDTIQQLSRLIKVQSLVAQMRQLISRAMTEAEGASAAANGGGDVAEK